MDQVLIVITNAKPAQENGADIGEGFRQTSTQFYHL